MAVYDSATGGSLSVPPVFWPQPLATVGVFSYFCLCETRETRIRNCEKTPQGPDGHRQGTLSMATLGPSLISSGEQGISQLKKNSACESTCRRMIFVSCQEQRIGRLIRKTLTGTFKRPHLADSNETPAAYFSYILQSGYLWKVASVFKRSTDDMRPNSFQSYI